MNLIRLLIVLFGIGFTYHFVKSHNTSQRPPSVKIVSPRLPSVNPSFQSQFHLKDLDSVQVPNFDDASTQIKTYAQDKLDQGLEVLKKKFAQKSNQEMENVKIQFCQDVIDKAVEEALKECKSE